MLTLNTRDMFFDRKAVINVIDQKKKSALSRVGGLTRRVSRQSIKYRKKRTIKSAPGKPPIAHTKGLGIRTIFYAYDPAADSVVCGPVRLGSTKRPDIPEILEKGGQSVLKVRRQQGSSAPRASGRSANGRFVGKRKRSPAELARIKAHYVAKHAARKTATVAVKIEPRPFMGPALEVTKAKIPGLFKD